MKGSAISVRIADFLKDYPPFQFVEIEDLRELANSGKVKFHEDGEIVFSQGQPRNQWLFVIQQGSVRILDESNEEEILVDLRGPGDILGLQGIRSDEPYLHTCKTETEAILYGFPRNQFVEMVEKSARARRYLAAYFSLNPAYDWGGFSFEEEPAAGEGASPVTLRKGGLWEVDPPQNLARMTLVTAMGDTPVREVAKRLQSKWVDCVVVVDENGWPIGKLTDGHLRNHILEGSVQPTAPVREFMSTNLVSAASSENTADLLVKLAKYDTNFLIVTEDGSLNSKALGLVSERHLFLQYGRFPTVISEAIVEAPDINALRLLRGRLESLILEFLESRRSLVWLMKMVGVLNRKLSKRIIELEVEAIRNDGMGSPPAGFSWLMMGSGGRDELLIRSAVYHALVYEDPATGKEAEYKRYFAELANRTSHALRVCGFLESPQNVLAQQSGWCLSLSQMKEKFSDFIKEPVANHVYSARDAFDFQPLSEDCPLAAKLSQHIDSELTANPEFIRHMARDSFQNQPPRTIFSGYVVDNEGIRRDELEIKSHALLPLVDVGRVLALEAGSHRPTATHQRLAEAAERCGIETPMGNLLREASEGFLVSQYARISQGLQSGTDGAVIHPAELEPETRTLLITTFRTILEIFESTAKRFDLNWRD